MTYIFLLLFIINAISYGQNKMPCSNFNSPFAIYNKQYKKRINIRNNILTSQLLSKSNTNQLYINKFRSLQLKLNEIFINYFSMKPDEKEVIELIIGLII